MPEWARALLWTMVVLGIPCALWLWVDFVLGPLRRWVWRRTVGSDTASVQEASPTTARPAPRSVPPRGRERP